MIGPLDGCWEKISRAKTHLAQLKDEFTPGPNNRLYQTFTEHQSKSGEYVINARIRHEAFVRWAVIVGEIAHDLRSALNHAVCAIARRADASLDCAGLEFPIYLKPLESGDRRKELIGMRNPKAEAVIESIQPHVAGDGAERHPLYVLHRMNIWDKHRDIPIGVVSLRIEPDLAAPTDSYRPDLRTQGEVLNDGTTLLTISVTNPRGVDMKREPILFIRFDQPNPARPEPFGGRGVPVLAVLDDCVRIVEDAITRLGPFVA